jgi:hypothetical protein
VPAWEVIIPSPREVEAERRHHPVRVVGDCPPETVCLRCHQLGDVKRVVDASAPGSKSETLHVSCAEAWFGHLASTTIEPDVPIARNTAEVIDALYARRIDLIAHQVEHAMYLAVEHHVEQRQQRT